MMQGLLNEGEVTMKKGKMAGVRTVSKEENYKIILSRGDNGKANFTDVRVGLQGLCPPWPRRRPASPTDAAGLAHTRWLK